MTKTIDQLIEEVHAWARSKGWWDKGIEARSLGDQFANFHSEISEGWEEYRKHGINSNKFLYSNPDTASHSLADPATGELIHKPEGIAAELADTLIRIFDTCGAYGIPLAEAIEMKMRYNDLRSHRHGGKVA